ncbi:hypothetical protein CNX65_33225 [Actinosynnema pretiosum]|uniref:Uncharacterized protein n=1 Tax=Actinosynnema pretiosum TaxID=42197 RepID=A0A290ZF14_9PSEU|nr:hypothetical protein CNX65_33225 [Actinosynnema pretiosum]
MLRTGDPLGSPGPAPPPAGRAREGSNARAAPAPNAPGPPSRRPAGPRLRRPRPVARRSRTAARA